MRARGYARYTALCVMLLTSSRYGHGKSEEVLGKALAGVPREAYYINTKCGRYESNVMDMFNFSAGRKSKQTPLATKNLLEDTDGLPWKGATQSISEPSMR